MKKKLLHHFTLMVTIATTIIFMSGCGDNSKERERQNREAEDMVYAAYMNKDYTRIIELVDSLHPSASICRFLPSRFSVFRQVY